MLPGSDYNLHKHQIEFSQLKSMFNNFILSHSMSIVISISLEVISI